MSTRRRFTGVTMASEPRVPPTSTPTINRYRPGISIITFVWLLEFWSGLGYKIVEG